jgi:hypothetical protein
MKTMLKYTVAAKAAALVGLACATPALGAPSSAQSECTFSGSVTAVDSPDHTLAAKGWFMTRNFILGRDCKVSLQDKPVAALTDLQPGQQVDIRYRDENGVRIATHIAQHDLAYSGHIVSINPQDRTLLIKTGAMTRQLTLAPNCAVHMRRMTNATLASLQTGDAVYVVYDRVNGSHVAQRIEENSAMFVGTIDAIDASSHSLKISDKQGERRFDLADNCPIVIDNRLNGTLYNLQIGERVKVDYNNVDGVLVADRVSPLVTEPMAPPPQSAQNDVTVPDYPNNQR